ncbi:MAG: endonuclease/exonuclease/phosphatase family protein [Cyanobacteria bacterium P01_G01_bin.39]
MATLISEFQPNPIGEDPSTQTIELSGTPGSSFTGAIISIESDGNDGTVDSAASVSGTFDNDGLLTVDIPDLENPSFTVALLSEFTGTVGTTDIDSDDDGVADDLSTLGTVFDAIAVPDAVADEASLYADDLGGTNFAFTGDEPRLVFRDGSVGDLFAVNDPDNGEVFDINGVNVTPAIFDADPTSGTDTFGAINPSVTGDPDPDPDPDELTPISEIQGAALTSPLEGSSVTTSGIVTAVESNGFYLQDPTGDEDDATADGIFVFTSDAPGVTVGDELEVAGTVSEFTPGGVDTGNLSTTQISGSPSVTVISSGNSLPEAVIIGDGGRVPPTESIDDDPSSFNPDADGIDFFESLEGMLVTAQDAVAVSGNTPFGEIFTVIDVGAGATGISDRGTLNISPDDFNPERVQIDEDTDILPGFDFPVVDTGASLGDVTGVVTYSFGNFEINPTEAFTVTPTSLDPESSSIDSGGDQLTVASYNVLNLDPNDGADLGGDNDIADGRFDAIASDIVNNLNAPDIIGLQEIQDNDGAEDEGGDTDVVAADETLQLLVDAIAANGGPTYEFIDNTFITDDANGGEPGGNIRTAYLYDPSRVDLVEGSVASFGSQAPGGAFEGSRLPLVADFEFNGQEVTIVNNHFTSKGGSSPILGVDQPFEDLQEDFTVNGGLDERIAQAQANDAFVDEVLAANPDANVVVLGDLNEFEFISPVDEIIGSSLTNLVDTLPEDERYSFIFQGNSQTLDHILISDSLVDGAEFDIVHVNAEFAATDERASDHDPLLASLALESIDPPEPEVNEVNGTRNDDDLSGTSGDDFITANNGNDTVSGLGGNDTIEGGRGGDIISGGVGDDVLAADRVDRFQDFDGEVSELRGNAGNDTLIGGGKNDLMIGGQGNDELFGQSGDDELRGNAGDDLLNGGVGNDVLIGGQGMDTADYSDLVFNGVFGTVAGLDGNLTSDTLIHSSANNALTWTDTITNIENVTATIRNDRLIGSPQDNVFDGQGEVGRSDRQTEFVALSGETYTVIADVVEYTGAQSDFSFAGSADNFTASANGEGTDTLIDIEFVRFNADDAVVATSDLSFA